MTKIETSQTGTTSYIHIHMAPSNSYYEVSVESIGLMMEYLLSGALKDYLGYKNIAENYINAKHWLFFEDSEDFTGFNMCCIILNQNPDKIRFRIQQLRDMGKTKLSEFEFTKFLDECRRD